MRFTFIEFFHKNYPSNWRISVKQTSMQNVREFSVKKRKKKNIRSCMRMFFHLYADAVASVLERKSKF